MPKELTFLNLRENLKILLGMQGVPYIHDSQREFNAINKFVMAEFTPDYVIELIGKLIEIKRHAKLGKENFWRGCAVNLSDVYAYRVKIETVYPTISTGGQASLPITQSKDMIHHVSTPTDPWKTFLHWTKKLTKSSQAEINQLTAVISKVDAPQRLIVVSGNPPEQLQKFITSYWTNAGYSIVYKTGDTNEPR